MDKNEINLGKWVDERLSLLNLPDNCRLGGGLSRSVIAQDYSLFSSRFMNWAKKMNQKLKNVILSGILERIVASMEA